MSLSSFSSPLAYSSYASFCEDLKSKFLYRHVDSSENAPPLLLDFTTNDYLGLSHHPRVIAAAQHYAQMYGVGGRASRLLHTDQSIYQALEAKIAVTKGTQDALIFNSGYQANATILAALLDKRVLGAEPLVFSDRLNHASIHHGCQLAGVRQIRYQHLDMTHLETLLIQHASSSQPKFILTETVFGMDGDCVDLQALTDLAGQHNAFVYVDEAHATGIVGKTGYGLSCEFSDKIHLQMGTFSKAIGVSGAYIACSRSLKEYLVNKCTGFIYSTAPSPAVIGAVDAAWELIPAYESQRQQLLRDAASLAVFLAEKGAQIGGGDRRHSNIIPLILKDADRCLQLSQDLLAKGIRVSAIRPPTVPPGTARVRIALNVQHSREDIARLKEHLFAWL